jgi:predicted nucleic acid-binding protein
MPVRTFIDSGVLIAAHKGEPGTREKALAVLEDSERVFLTSPFLYIEVVPKPTHFKRHSELAFYRAYFTDPSVEWCRDLDAIYDLSIQLAERFGLAAMDAFHVAAARLLRADELITIERPEKSIHRASIVKVIQL